jgi:hypothetical protein
MNDVPPYRYVPDSQQHEATVEPRTPQYNRANASCHCGCTCGCGCGRSDGGDDDGGSQGGITYLVEPIVETPNEDQTVSDSEGSTFVDDNEVTGSNSEGQSPCSCNNGEPVRTRHSVVFMNEQGYFHHPRTAVPEWDIRCFLFRYHGQMAESRPQTPNSMVIDPRSSVAPSRSGSSMISVRYGSPALHQIGTWHHFVRPPLRLTPENPTPIVYGIPWPVGSPLRSPFVDAAEYPQSIASADLREEE